MTLSTHNLVIYEYTFIFIIILFINYYKIISLSQTHFKFSVVQLQRTVLRFIISFVIIFERIFLFTFFKNYHYRNAQLDNNWHCVFFIDCITSILESNQNYQEL